MLKEFEKDLIEKTKGSEFEYVIQRAREGDKGAKELMRDKTFQRRLFTHINRKTKKPEQLLTSILLKAGAAIAIVLFERLLNLILKPRKA